MIQRLNPYHIGGTEGHILQPPPPESAPRHFPDNLIQHERPEKDLRTLVVLLPALLRALQLRLGNLTLLLNLYPYFEFQACMSP